MILALLFLISFGFGITLEEAINTALEKNPQIKALERRIEAFKGREISSYAFPNPEVRIESGFVTNDKDGEPKGRALFLFEFMQPIPLWGVRDKARKVVIKEKEAFEFMKEAEVRKIVGDVYEAFFEALYRKEVVSIRERELQRAKAVREFVEKTYRLGETTPLELLRSKREESIARLNLEVAKARYSASLKRLSAVVSENIESVEGDIASLLDIPFPQVESLPQIVALERQKEAILRRIFLEKSLAKPQASAGFVVEDSEEGYYGMRLALGFSFPIFYRRQGEILELQSLKEAIEEEVKARKIALENNLLALRVRIETLKEEIKKLEKEVIPRAEEELALAEKSYKLRAITLLELSDVRRRYFDLLLERSNLLLDLHRAYADLIRLGGWK